MTSHLSQLRPEEIQFATGNQSKLAEVRRLLGPVRQLSLDLVEIQELEAPLIIKAKLELAQAAGHENVLVEDTSLEINGLGGLPGPLVKWFEQALGLERLAELAEKSGDPRACARTSFGFAASSGQIIFAEGELRGLITNPRGTGFGWDAIFQPDGFSQTLGEMSREQKDLLSMRSRAVDQLRKKLGWS